MTNRKKIIIVSLFILFGAAMLCYGAFYHTKGIEVPNEEDSAILVKSEPALIKLVSIGGIKRDETGKFTQTFGEGQEAPKACPT